MAQVIKATVITYIKDTYIQISKQVACKLNFDPVQVFKNSHTRLGFKKTA